MLLSGLIKKIKKGIEPCKYCANPTLKLKDETERKTEKKNSSRMFNETHPELVKEWSERNRLRPNQVPEFSKTEVIWKCEKCGKEWTARVADRSRGYKNCPSCYPFGKHGGKRLADVRPDLRKYYSPENDTAFDDISSQSGKSRIWICDKGHRICKSPANVMKYKDFFAQNALEDMRLRIIILLLIIQNSLKNGIMKKNNALGLDPNKLLESSNGLPYWKCKRCGRSYQQRINRKILADAEGKISCPYCDNRKASEDNNLAITNPEVLCEWDYEANKAEGIDPHKVLAHNGIMAHWICSNCSSHYDMTISERVQREEDDQISCPYCRGWLVNETNCLTVTNPEILSEWDYDANTAEGIDPRNVLARNAIMAHWICSDCGSHYDMTINERVQRENNGQISCPYCRGWLVNETNCLKTIHPDLMKEWAPWENALIEVEADKITENYNGKAWWICPICNYKYSMSVKIRCLKEKRHQNACPRCNGRLQKRVHFF